MHRGNDGASHCGLAGITAHQRDSVVHDTVMIDPSHQSDRYGTSVPVVPEPTQLGKIGMGWVKKPVGVVYEEVWEPDWSSSGGSSSSSGGKACAAVYVWNRHRDHRDRTTG